MEISRRKIMVSISVGAMIGLVLASAVALSKVSVHGKYLPGTNIAGIDLSYMSPEEATAVLATKKTTYLATPIKISILGATKEFLPEALGVNILVEETVKTLSKTDARELGLLSVVKSSALKGESKQPVVTVNSEVLSETIRENFALWEIAPKQANFFFDEKGKLAIAEGREGIVVDERTLAKDLRRAAKNFSSPEIAAAAQKRQPEITVAQLDGQKAQIEEALNHEIALLDPVYSDNWYLKLKDHLDWIKFTQKQRVKIPYLKTTESLEDHIEGAEGEYFISIEIDQEKLDRFVDEKISKWLDRQAESVNIYRDETGKVKIEGKGSNGKKIQRKFLKQSIELALENRIRDVPIPVLEITPEISISKDLRELGITERIGMGHTSYYRSPANRVHNIKVGAEKFNGLIIAPDEVFSFNDNLGRVDGTTGYKKELVIKKEGTIPEFGGGICQVSTTMYRAVMFSGLPVVERNKHSYAVSYYSQILGHGLDATIYLGGADMRFKNDTGHHILVQTYTDPDYELYIVFYGTKDGRQVEMEGPYLSNYRNPGPTIYEDTPDLPAGKTKQVEKNHTGFDALWYRHLTRPDGTVEKEPIETSYRAIPAKILVGTGATE